MNFDVHSNQVRSILRGDVNGGARFLLVALCVVVAWGAAGWMNGLSRSSASSLTLQRGRYASLVRLAAEYRAIAPGQKGEKMETSDALTAFNQVASDIVQGDRVSRIVPMPDGKRLSVEINRIYAEELAEMIRGLMIRGIYVISAEIRAIPSGEERLLSMTLIIGPDM
ncbi:MAG: hypothetical protein LBR61_11950 [Synergistaceae bacterium]|nr:hypothetical protein [Synergistaceae bacterium]